MILIVPKPIETRISMETSTSSGLLLPTQYASTGRQQKKSRPIYGAEDVDDDRWTLLHWSSYDGSAKPKKTPSWKARIPNTWMLSRWRRIQRYWRLFLLRDVSLFLPGSASRTPTWYGRSRVYIPFLDIRDSHIFASTRSNAPLPFQHSGNTSR